MASKSEDYAGFKKDYDALSQDDKRVVKMYMNYTPEDLDKKISQYIAMANENVSNYEKSKDYNHQSTLYFLAKQMKEHNIPTGTAGKRRRHLTRRRKKSTRRRRYH